MMDSICTGRGLRERKGMVIMQSMVLIKEKESKEVHLEMITYSRDVYWALLRPGQC